MTGLTGFVGVQEEPATARQKLIITRLCMALGIRDAAEERPMSKGEAGRLIRRMERQVKAKRSKG